MASAADVRSILALPSQSSAPAAKPQPTQSQRKPEGISRELFSLIGDSAPSLAAQFVKPRLKQKPNLGGGESRVKWEWRSFANGARTDSLRLSHWVRASTDPSQEYPFARYNVQATTYTYSQDEYTKLLEDKEWSKEETDYLFSLVNEYDTRWYVIHDRYSFPDGVPRSIEDLKDRYFGICKTLVRARPWAGDEASKNHLISTLTFEKVREKNRKKYIESLETRTPEQAAEEEALYVEVKRLEQNERRFRKEREELLRTLAGIDSGLPDIVEDENPFGSMTGIDTKKKKKGSSAMDIDSPSTPTTISLLPAPVPKRSSGKVAAQEAANYIVRIDPPTGSYKASHVPAHLRSYKLPVPKTTILDKVKPVFAELGISQARLVMYTRENIAQYELLLEAVTSLLETKKVADKVEQDIRTAKHRLGMRVSEEAGTPAADAMEVDEAAETQAADLDGDADVEEEGRAQSVVSTRSTRSRKQSRRSSISSVDTISVRNSHKRQKKS